MLPRPPSSTLFPYTTLFRSGVSICLRVLCVHARQLLLTAGVGVVSDHVEHPEGRVKGELHHRAVAHRVRLQPPPDRKSTRLNSSHSQISYAVFCLKKKINS